MAPSKTALVLLIALLWGGAAFASTAPPRIRLSGALSIARLLDLAASDLDQEIDYSPQDLERAEWTIRSRGELDRDTLWEVVNTALAAHGRTTVSLAGSNRLQVVSNPEASKLAPIEAFLRNGVPDDVDALLWGEDPAPPGYAALMVRPAHREAQVLLPAMQAVLEQGGASVVETGDGAVLLLKGLRPRVQRALELLRELDSPRPAAQVEEMRLRHLPAERMLTLLEQLRAKRELVTGRKLAGEVVAGPERTVVLVIAPAAAVDQWRELIQRLDRAEPLATETYVPQAFSAADVAALIEQTLGGEAERRLRVVVDELTGSLIVTATPGQHEQIEALLARLEETPPARRRPVRLFAIRNRTAAEVAGIVGGLLEAGVLSGGAFEPGLEPVRDVPPSRPDPAGRPRDGERAVGETNESERRLDSTGRRAGGPRPDEPPPLTITIDEGTNTIIAIGEPLLLDRLEELIAQLDIRAPQVEVEVLLISLSESETRDLGVELEALITSGDVRARLASLFGLSSASSPTERSVGNPPGFTGLVLDPGEFAVVVRALETLNEGRSLSIPKVLVGDNQQATLSSVAQQPVVSINASDTVATTSFGGFTDAGTTVAVTPHISEADHLILEYQVQLSSFVGESSSPGVPPPRQQNQIQSVATIPDGFAIAVGGIEIISEAEAESRTPILGSLPLVEHLFKNRSKSFSRSRFFVFIRPTVLRDRGFADLKYLSEVAQDEAGIDADWPVVEPRLIR